MAIPKSEASSRSARPSTASQGSHPKTSKAAAKNNKAPVDAKKQAAKDAADAKQDEAKARAWEAAKKEAAYALLSAAAHKVPILRGDPEERTPAPKPSNKASAGQRNKAESLADGVPQRRSNPLPPPPPPPHLKPASIASAGQRNRAESMADGVAQRRSNPLPSAPKPSNQAAAGQRARAESMADGVAQRRSNPLPASLTAAGRLVSPLDPFIRGAANSPTAAARPTASARLVSDLDPYLAGTLPAPTASPRPQPTPAGSPPPSPAPGAAKGFGERWADLTAVGEARLDGFGQEVGNAAAGLGQWLWRTGAGAVDWASDGDNWKAAGQKAWAATMGSKAYAENPQLATLQWKQDFVGGLGSAAWDAGQGVVWGGAQVVATAVEVVKLGGRITNATSYLLTGEHKFEIESKTAWQSANEIVSGYGGAAKQEMQKFGYEHLGMRTGYGGTHKSGFFVAGEVAGNVASVAIPAAGAASKAGLLGRAAAAGDDVIRAGRASRAGRRARRAAPPRASTMRRRWGAKPPRPACGRLRPVAPRPTTRRGPPRPACGPLPHRRQARPTRFRRSG
jgi:hypothetical protein